MNKGKNKSIYDYLWVIVIFLFAILAFQFLNLKNSYISEIMFQKEKVDKEAKKLLDSIKIRIEGKSLYEMRLIPKSQVSDKTDDFVLFYIPSQICFTCVENLIKVTSRKKKNEMVFLIENSPNSALQGLIKYYKMQDICEYDSDSIFYKKVSNGVQVKKPLAFMIKGKIIKSSFILDEDEKELEGIFRKLTDN